MTTSSRPGGQPPDWGVTRSRRWSSKSGSAVSCISRYEPSSLSRRTVTLRRASASAMPCILPMLSTRSWSNGPVKISADDGLLVLVGAVSPDWSIALAPAMVPIANTPTAIESTTRTRADGMAAEVAQGLAPADATHSPLAPARPLRPSVPAASPSSVPSRIRPSAMCTVRRVRRASSASWVTVTIVRPWSTSCSNSANTMSAVAESRLPVGSSATISGGSLARARATATRCC